MAVVDTPSGQTHLISTWRYKASAFNMTGMLPRTEVQGSERKPTEGRLLLLARKFISG